MLSVSVNGIQFRNPLILASGILDESGATMLRIARAGAGGIVTKSVGAKERAGYGNPVVYELPHERGIINAIGLANPGIDAYGEELRIALQGGVPIIGSVFGSTAEEFAALAKKMEEYGVHAVELNLSCPHASGYGMEVGVDKKLVREIVSAVKSEVQVPVWAKLTPNTHDLRGIAAAAEDADAFVLINTVRGMAIDINARRPVLSNAYGGLSGPCIKPVGVRAVYEIAREFDTPIIGVGGITTGEDAIEYMMAGASAVQIGTAILYRGINAFREIAGEIESWLIENGIEKVSELVGMAQVR
ncbi:MAG: dihydroorotate dehydrogenase [Euryarchaeota archaeon]|nr:dihydroorotate dehydrogenase [Euryarchaeota archaeon]